MSAEHKVESPDHSLSIAEAAAHLGVAPATIRRRIKTGEIGAFKRTTAYGFEWRILLEGESEALITNADQHVITPIQKPDHVVESADHTPTTPEIDRLLSVIERLQEDHRDVVEQLREENARTYEAARFWQARAIQAEEQVRLLTAPKDEPADVTPNQPPREAEPSAEPVRVSWWKRLLGS